MLEIIIFLIGLLIGWNTTEPKLAKDFKLHLLNFIREQTEKKNNAS